MSTATTPLNSQLFLENGDCLTNEQFFARWENMPDLKHAELIDGVVYMNAALRQRYHGNPVARVIHWLSCYAAETIGVEVGTESSVILGEHIVVQPDAALMISPEYAGQTHLDEQGLLVGPPELVVEVAASSASRDLHQKWEAYQKAGVLEYLVWNVEEQQLRWFVLKDGQYSEQQTDQTGILKSKYFPGLWLNPADLLNGPLKSLQQIVHKGIESSPHSKFLKQLDSQRKS